MTNRGTSPITVLIADDHPVVRQGLRGMLAADDIEVVGEAGTGWEAVALVRQLSPDVVLMDVRMPEMDGLAAMAEMKKTDIQSAVIVLTTYYNVRYLVRAVIYGAAAYFLKGIARDELLGAIRAVHAGESLLKIPQLRAIVDRVLKEDSKLAPAAVKKMRGLTRREREILGLVVQGLTNRQIAELLCISQATVKTHVENIIEKLGVSDRTQAAVWAVRAGVAEP
jgi:DNA-binding NarL/FixJ family response regulator